MSGTGLLKILGHMKKLLNDQSGMTLIDMAMVLMVLGLLLTPALGTYKNWKIEKERGETQKNQLAINKAIADYYFINGEYPCPANPALGPQDANYGVADCPATLTAGGAAYIGGVPFTELLLPTDATLDGFRNKFTYAVSANLVNGATFAAGGQLDTQARDCTTGALASAHSDTHFIILSHGENGVGARTANGTPRQACPAAGTNTETENCDGDVTFVEQNCAASSAGGSGNFYDDLTFYTWAPPTRIWAESSADPDDIMTNVGKVGINNTNPEFSLDVVGNIRASDTWVNEICDLGNMSNPAAAAGCFRPELIGGDEPDMDCANNTDGSTIMTGIGNSKAKCNISHTLPATDCAAAGGYIVGIGAGGTIQCGS